jgi:Zn-dependent protease
MAMPTQPATPPPTPHGGGGGVRLGVVFGIPVYLRASWLFLAVPVTLLYGGVIAGRRPELGSVAYLIAFGFVVCLVVSVLLHEAGHAVTARRHGLGVRGITIELLGGYTELDREAPTPKAELVVALAGPAVSFALGAVAAVGTWLSPPDSLGNQILFQLAVSNLVVAVFNVLPGLPLDGGRALRGLVWSVSGDPRRATIVAGWSGRVIAAASAIAGAILFAEGIFGVISFVFVGLMAVNLWQSASQSLIAANVQARFPLLHVGSLAVPILPVPSGMPLAEALRLRAASARPDAALGIVDGGGVLRAVVDPRAAAAVPVPRQPWVWVDSVARAVEGSRRIDAALRGADVIKAVQTDPATEYLVTHRDHVVGVLRVADVVRLLENRG